MEAPRLPAQPLQRGIEFGALARVLAIVMALYAGASLLQWLQGYILNDVVQSTVRRMRGDVEEKAPADRHGHEGLLPGL